jgi:hypothetical protein
MEFLILDTVDAGDEDTYRRNPACDPNTQYPLSRVKSQLKDEANATASVGEETYQADRSLLGQIEVGGDMISRTTEKTGGFLKRGAILDGVVGIGGGAASDRMTSISSPSNLKDEARLLSRTCCTTSEVPPFVGLRASCLTAGESSLFWQLR